jgi:FkbM family methyltransferase
MKFSELRVRFFGSQLPVFLMFKSMIMRTIIGAVGLRLRWHLGAFRRYRHPELWELYLEEQRLPLVLAKLLRNDSCVVDVGAHIGSFLRLALKYAPNGQHWAFEASPTKAHWLHVRFPNVKVVAVGVACRSGTAVFSEDYERPGFSSLVQAPAAAIASKAIEVPTRRLDDELEGTQRLDLIKLDIEGGELDALCGAVSLIQRLKPAIIFESGTVYPSGQHRALFEFITNTLSYEIFGLADFLFDKGAMSFSEFQKCGMYPFRGFNFVALPAGSASEPGERCPAVAMSPVRPGNPMTI